MGSAPFLGGGFGHFYAYAPEKIEYADRPLRDGDKRQLDVLDRLLAESRFVAGDDYTIADMAIWPWYGALARASCTRPASSWRCTSTSTCGAGPTRSRSARR